MAYRRSDTSKTSIYDDERNARALAEVQLDKCNCYLLDMDQTLARYRLGAVYELVHRALLSFMVDERGYSAALKEQVFDSTFCLKGLVFDHGTGDVLKIDEDGYICMARHGYAAPFMPPAEIKARYPGSRWPRHEQMRRRERGAYFLFNTLFDVPLVDSEDAGAGVGAGAEAGYAFVPDLMAGLEHTYSPPSFGLRRGMFFPALLAEPARFLAPRPTTRAWLEAQRSRGRRLFLVTNSHVDFSEFVMQVSFGAGWRALFDGVVFFARKGKGFFELPASETPFFRLKHDARTLPCGESVCPGGGAANELGERAGELELGGEYLQGHHSLMGGWVRDPARAAYFGDHLLSDVLAVRDSTAWSAVALVSELRPADEAEAALGAAWGDFFAGAPPGAAGGAARRSFLGAVAEDAALVCIADFDDLS